MEDNFELIELAKARDRRDAEVQGLLQRAGFSLSAPQAQIPNESRSIRINSSEIPPG